MSILALTILFLSVASFAGLALGNIKVKGVSIGIGGVLFSGLIVGHFMTLYGISLNAGVLHFVREIGLILFVYMVGLQAGPRFFSSLRKNGLLLNALAVGVVLMGAAITVVLFKTVVPDLPTVLGLFAGAVTNTPALGSAQQILSDLNATGTGTIMDVSVTNMAYAMAYPFGIAGIIFSVILLRVVLKINVTEEEKEFEDHKPVLDLPQNKCAENPHVIRFIPIFIGISLGVLLGSMSFYISGIAVPIKLGLAGGPLIVALILGHFGKIAGMSFYFPKVANHTLKEFGIILFLAVVGISSGGSFFDVLINGDGLLWIGYGLLITLVPMLVIAFVSRLFFKLNYLTIAGMMAGTMTDPPALAFANDLSLSSAASLGYATVYPLTMCLRILAPQLIAVLLF